MKLLGQLDIYDQRNRRWGNEMTLEQEHRLLKDAINSIASGIVKPTQAWELANAVLEKINQSKDEL